MIENKYKAEKLQIELTSCELQTGLNIVQAVHSWVAINEEEKPKSSHETLAFLGALEELGGLFYNLIQKENKTSTVLSLTKTFYYHLMAAYDLPISNMTGIGIDYVDRNSLFMKLHQEGTNLRWLGYNSISAAYIDYRNEAAIQWARDNPELLPEFPSITDDEVKEMMRKWNNK